MQSQHEGNMEDMNKKSIKSFLGKYPNPCFRVLIYQQAQTVEGHTEQLGSMILMKHNAQPKSVNILLPIHQHDPSTTAGIFLSCLRQVFDFLLKEKGFPSLLVH